MSARGLLACAALLLTCPAARAAVPPTPIPSGPASPAYIGARSAPRPVPGVPRTPRNPFMAPNGRSEIHNDAWQTDVYAWSGPLGRSPVSTSTLLNRDCGSIAFDRRGRLVSVCIGLSGPQLYMLDPRTLATLATFALPPRQSAPTGNIFQDFTGGAYFYLDDHDRVVTSTTTKHIYVIGERTAPPGFKLVGDYDLGHVLRRGENITSALPDSRGLLWFVARADGVVGTLDFATRRIRVIRLGHGAVAEIENSFATDQSGGVYIATNRKLYRFTAGHRGVPEITWQVAYPNSYRHKPGQVDDGTGTTPTLMPGGLVNITDNADPMDVMVYRTAVRPTRELRAPGGHLHRVALPRTVCRVPVFRRGASDTENSLIAARRAMIVENNYGYSDPSSVSSGKVSAAGLARVDIDRSGYGCHLVWTNWSVRAPTVVPKLSLASGLIYTYTKAPGGFDPWYWTAVDFATGRTRFEQLAGTGALHNNNYAGIAVGPRGAAYLGVIGGIVAMRDGG